MAKREVKKERGVFERPKGSGVWWINYYHDGKQHREKGGTRTEAKDLYKERKAAARRGEKLPDLSKGKVTLSALIDTWLLPVWALADLHQTQLTPQARVTLCLNFCPMPPLLVRAL